MDMCNQILIPILTAVLASSGIWSIFNGKMTNRDARSDMLIGLGHDRIISLCVQYIDRGYITSDEYENLNDYLYGPYKKLGGNGSAERLMKEVNNLKIHKSQ